MTNNDDRETAPDTKVAASARIATETAGTGAVADYAPRASTPSPAVHKTTAIACLTLVAAMGGLSYAAVPLYQMFCRVTGYGGTTQVAIKPSDHMVGQTITMRFDSNVSGGLDWSFKPVQRLMDVRLGENKLASYRAKNTSDVPLVGTASFNVTPESAGIYFNKIECFCFTEQRLEPGESMDMPVSFYVDPDMLADKDAKHISQITLSYTFYPSGETAAKKQAGVAPEASGAAQPEDGAKL